MAQRRVVTYARVSTEHEAQTHAFENQIDWYADLIKQHPEWTLVEPYADKGLSGTSIEKRPDFKRMMEDARQHKFDLIITREVSRFARNTVDALSCTHELRNLGIEVYFVNDGIWSLDSDGDLRLTIMAAVAQEESRKVSSRAKAGQAISRQKGVYYGTGNILGYKRVESQKAGEAKRVEFLQDPEQARTVRKMFDMYLDGKGLRAIQLELERLGYKTASGNVHWHQSTISRTLQNPFYCGVIRYRLQWTPDYLEHKKINNIADMPFEYAQGTHEPIVTAEEFAEVQELFAKNRNDNATIQRDEYGKIIPDEDTPKRQRYFGKRKPLDVWSELLVCGECGAHFNRSVWHRLEDGTKQFAYQCYSQKKTGSKKTRENHGLSTEGICDTQMVPEWKLQMMAENIFADYVRNRRRSASLVKQLQQTIAEQQQRHEQREENHAEEIRFIEIELEKQKKRLVNFQTMRADGEISKEDYLARKTETEIEIQNLLKQKAELMPTEVCVDDDAEARFEDFLKEAFNPNNYDKHGKRVITQNDIRAFVKNIVVYKDHIDWYLRYNTEDAEPISCTITGGKRKGDETPSFAYCGTGCHQGKQVIPNVVIIPVLPIEVRGF